MGTAAKKKRPMRSRRSGVKKFELVKANLAILSKLAALFIIIMFAACTPVRYVNIERYHTYRYRPNVHSVPVWVQGHGVILQQQHWHRPKPQRIPRKH